MTALLVIVVAVFCFVLGMGVGRWTTGRLVRLLCDAMWDGDPQVAAGETRGERLRAYTQAADALTTGLGAQEVARDTLLEVARIAAWRLACEFAKEDRHATALYVLRLRESWGVDDYYFAGWEAQGALTQLIDERGFGDLGAYVHSRTGEHELGTQVGRGEGGYVSFEIPMRDMDLVGWAARHLRASFEAEHEDLPWTDDPRSPHFAAVLHHVWDRWMYLLALVAMGDGVRGPQDAEADLIRGRGA